MCEKRTRKIKKRSHWIRYREIGRMQRLPETGPAAPESAPTSPQGAEMSAHSQLMLELARRTLSLMQKNTIIQQKLMDLQKETSEHVAAVMKHPENQRRYHEYLRLYGNTTPNLFVPIVADCRPIYPVHSVPIRFQPYLLK